MAILVSGGAGYIGSHTCIELLNAGYDVVVADNYYNASPVVLDRVKQITGKDFRFYNADMTKHEDVEKIFTECPDITAGHRLRRPRQRAHHRGLPRGCHHQPLRYHQGFH